MTKQIELDGRVSALGKLDSRYWFYFRQNGETYGVLFDSLNLGLKPVNYKYEPHLRLEAAALAKSKKRSRRFKLPAFLDSVKQDGDVIKIKVLLSGPINQTIETRLYPSPDFKADMGIAVGVVMEKLDK